MLMEDKIEIAQEILEKSKNLANRWISAWGNESYRYAFNLNLDFSKRMITFFARNHNGCGYPDLIEIPFKYLVDARSLDTDAKAWYNDMSKKRLQAINEYALFLTDEQTYVATPPFISPSIAGHLSIS